MLLRSGKKVGGGQQRRGGLSGGHAPPELLADIARRYVPDFRRAFPDGGPTILSKIEGGCPFYDSLLASGAQPPTTWQAVGVREKVYPDVHEDGDAALELTERICMAPDERGQARVTRALHARFASKSRGAIMAAVVLQGPVAVPAASVADAALAWDDLLLFNRHLLTADQVSDVERERALVRPRRSSPSAWPAPARPPAGAAEGSPWDAWPSQPMVAKPRWGDLRAAMEAQTAEEERARLRAEDDAERAAEEAEEAERAAAREAKRAARRAAQEEEAAREAAERQAMAEAKARYVDPWWDAARVPPAQREVAEYAEARGRRVSPRNRRRDAA